VARPAGSSISVTNVFDLVVIGSGTAGSSVAGRCRKAEWTVAVIDERPFGGTCALRGCDPKKVLVGVAEAVDATQRLRGRGIVGNAGLDWRVLLQFKRSFTDPYPERKERSLREAGIEVVHGHARFIGPTRIQAGDRILEGRHVLIATGAHPTRLHFPGAVLLTTSDEFLELASLPPKVVFVGGGYISFEFAHVAARAGAAVTILHRGGQPLDGFDPELVGALVKHTRDIGIDVRTETEVIRIDQASGTFVVTGTNKGRDEQFVADLVVHGAGRAPALEALDLEAADISYTPHGIEVTDYLQSVSNPAVFAAGDVVSRGPALTPVAGYDGQVAAANLLNGLSEKVDYSAVPSVVFTIPSLASVGLLEADARRDFDVDVRSGDMSAWYSSRRIGERVAAYKTIVERGTGRILGAHLLGPHAEDAINLFTLAMRTGATSDDLKKVLFAYPTGASDVQYML
jgi:glutathione reductase (NADPH)